MAVDAPHPPVLSRPQMAMSKHRAGWALTGWGLFQEPRHHATAPDLDVPVSKAAAVRM
jgi:hypothetical protein